MRTILSSLLAIAALSCAQNSQRTVVQTADAPAAIGPYSQGIESSGFVFVSGQIAIDPATNQLIEGGTAAQTDRALRNLEAVLRASGLTMAHVVKTTVYMTDLADFPAMNAAYERYFSKSPPARSTVQVSALPRGAKVEIEAVARR